MKLRVRFGILDCLLGILAIAAVLVWTNALKSSHFHLHALLRLPQARLNWDQEKANVLNCVSSAELIDETVATLPASDEPKTRRILSRIDAKFVSGSEILRVSLQGRVLGDSEEECRQALSAHLATVVKNQKTLQMVQAPMAPDASFAMVYLLAALSMIGILLLVLFGRSIFSRERGMDHSASSVEYAQQA